MDDEIKTTFKMAYLSWFSGRKGLQTNTTMFPFTIADPKPCSTGCQFFCYESAQWVEPGIETILHIHTALKDTECKFTAWC